MTDEAHWCRLSWTWALFRFFPTRTSAVRKAGRRPERQHRVRWRSSRRRSREFVSEGESVFPDRPRPANGEAGSKAVCSVVLPKAVDVCLAIIVVVRADSCPPSLAYIVTVKGREYSPWILREDRSEDHLNWAIYRAYPRPTQREARTSSCTEGVPLILCAEHSGDQLVSFTVFLPVSG
jgi:hypothetical protein